MRLLHSHRAVDAVFDDANLVSCAGLVPVMRLAEQVDLAGLVAQRVRADVSTGSNPGGKAAAIVAGMVAGADSIEDLDLLRHGGMGGLFASVYAPSTLGSFLRFFTWGHALQLEAAARDLLAVLARRAPLLPDAQRLAYVDVDSLLRRVYGPGKQGAAFGHAKVGGYRVKLRGLSPLIATISTDQAAPVVATTRLRGGNAGSARAAASLVKQAITTARTAGASGRILVRGDSAYGSGPVVSACRAAGANFSLTLQSNPKLASRDRRHHPDQVDTGALPRRHLRRASPAMDLRRRGGCCPALKMPTSRSLKMPTGIPTHRAFSRRLVGEVSLVVGMVPPSLTRWKGRRRG